MLDRPRDDELRGHRRAAKQKNVDDAPRIREHEGDRREKRVGKHQRDESKRCREHCDVKHLVVAAHLKPLEQLLLEGARESIETQVAKHEKSAVSGTTQPTVGGHHLRYFAARVSAEKEQGATSGDCKCHHVFLPRVALEQDDGPPKHDWNHLCRLGERLHGERDVLERLILARGRDDVRDGYPRVCIEGRDWLEAFPFHDAGHEGGAAGQEAVEKHDEERVLEVVPSPLFPVRDCHYSFLQNPVTHQRPYYPSSAKGNARVVVGVQELARVRQRKLWPPYTTELA
mmetsp:Transcript_5981/g.10970  ORF Transcript_5981/g.10970 Transcript_5981/m.10970 type:complete len:286 (+) Transcript_5981:255-1112(+)